MYLQSDARSGGFMATNLLRSAILALSLFGTVNDIRAEQTEASHSRYVQAIWHLQQLQLHFHSFHNRYACDALEHKITHILKAVGARSDVAVSAGCMRGQFLSGAQVNIDVASPVAATADNIDRATTFNARERLVGRVRKTALPTPADLERFGASWENVSLTRDRQLHLTTADCELIAALNKQVFPQMAVQLNTRSFSCPSVATRVRPRVEVAALLASPVIPIARNDRL